MNAVINVYKEKGYTSFDVVAKLRGILHMKKIGHTGTLDPMAEGVLPVCVGSATKLCEMLTDHDKVYETVMHLGVVTDTQDATGNVLEENNPCVTEENIRSAVGAMVGGYEQMPPMYSAKKVNGRKLYDMARKGETVERKKTPVMIYDIEITAIDMPRVYMRVSCGKGTYIRTLCHDIGAILGCGAMMEELRRTVVGEFEIADALKLNEIEELVRSGEIEKRVIQVEDVFGEYPKWIAPEPMYKAVRNGNTINNARYTREGQYNFVRVYDHLLKFVGLYTVGEMGQLIPYKMFLND